MKEKTYKKIVRGRKVQSFFCCSATSIAIKKNLNQIFLVYMIDEDWEYVILSLIPAEFVAV